MVVFIGFIDYDHDKLSKSYIKRTLGYVVMCINRDSKPNLLWSKFLNGMNITWYV